jgi:hypothetical protein
MITPRQTLAINLYRGIMQEIRIRIAAIDSGTGNYLLTIPPPIVREFCYLQLRMVCELIAFGCLVAHGDMKDVRAPKLQKEWAADKIMEELERLHPAFYPYAARQMPTSTGLHLEVINPHPCPKAELIKIYHECGNVLHRGSLRKLIVIDQAKIIHYPKITAIAQKFVNFLQSSYLVTRDEHLVFLTRWLPNDVVEVALGAPPSELPPISLGPPTDDDSE